MSRTNLFRAILAILLACTSLFSIAQEELPDRKHFEAIKSILKLRNKTDVELVDSVFTYRHENGYWDPSEEACSELERLTGVKLAGARTIEEEYEWLRLKTTFANTCRSLGERVIAYERLIALARALEDTGRLAGSYEGLSLVYSAHQMLDQELEYSTKSINLLFASSEIDSGGRAHHATHHGYRVSQIAYERQDSVLLDSALKYTEIGYRFTDDDDPIKMDRIIVYAMTLARAGRREEAIRIGLEGFELSKRMKDTYYQFRFSRQLSGYYAGLGMADSAKHWIHVCFEIEQPGLEEGPNVIDLGGEIGLVELNSLYYLISAHLQLGEYNEASKILDKVLYSDFDKEKSSIAPYLEEIGADVYFRIGAFEKAAECYQGALEFADRIRSEQANNYLEANRAHTEVQIRLQREKVEAKEKQEKLLEKEEEQRERLIKRGLMIGSGGLLLFIAFLYGRFRVIRKQKVLIQSQKDTVEDALGQIGKKNKEILDSINYAGRLQKAILPSNDAFDKLFPENFILYEPKDIIAGDFYFLEETNDAVFLAVADCTGHGVPGAMVSVVCANALSKAIMEEGLEHPGEILDMTRSLVMKQFKRNKQGIKDGMDIALVRLPRRWNEMEEITVEFAGANNPLWVVTPLESKLISESRAATDGALSGHGSGSPEGGGTGVNTPFSPPDGGGTRVDKLPAPPEGGISDAGAGGRRDDKIFVSTSNDWELLEVKPDKQPIGEFVINESFTNQIVKVRKGDRLYLFTDGFHDQFGGMKGKKFKPQKLKKLILAIQNKPLKDQSEVLSSELKEWRGAIEQIDDVCIAAMEL